MTALKRLFSEGFRVFFLAAGLFAVLSMLVWVIWLALESAGIAVELPVAPAPFQWHAHEMIFGFGSAALGGFFLTAVPNWTGTRAAPHRFVAGAAALWLAGRVACGLSGSLPPGLVAVADLAFLPLLWGQIFGQLVRRPRPDQMIFLVLLLLFWTGNLLVHLDWLGWTATQGAGLRIGLLTLCALIMVLGGRVTPGFTRNAMVQAGRESRLPANPSWLAAVSIAAALVLPVGHLAGLPQGLMAAAALVAGAAGLGRVALWRSGWTRSRPILWTLHLSYAVNALGFLLLGLSGFGLGSELAALHLLGIGAVGGMSLSFMSRATLGHTGRPLVAPRLVVLSYGLVPLAALARVLAASLPALYLPGLLLAGGLWILAFALYVVALWPAFWGPRLPRAPVGQPRA